MRRKQEGMTEYDLLSMVTRRRSLSGEGYDAARKNLLEYLKGSGRITKEEYDKFKSAGKLPRM